MGLTTVTNWLDFDKVSGKAGDNSLTVTVDENSDLEGDRSGEIVIHSDNKELVFTITQVLSDKIAALGETSVELDANGGTAELKFSATKAWSATSTGSWLTLSKTSGEASYDNAISITAPVNIEADRTAQVKIVCGTAELTYTVQQKFINGISVIGSDKVNLPELGGEAEINFLPYPTGLRAQMPHGSHFLHQAEKRPLKLQSSFQPVSMSMQTVLPQ